MTRGKVHLRMFSHSEMQTFANCPNLWGYMYPERLRPNRVAAYFRWGGAWHRIVGRTIEDVHDVLGNLSRYAPGAAHETALVVAVDYVKAELVAARALESHDQEEIDEAAAWLTFHARHYFERTQCDWLDYVVLAVELPFRVPLRDSMGRPIAHAAFEGVIDLLMYHRPTGRVAVMDHKALASLANADRRLELDDQTTGYLYAARELWRAKRLPHQSLPSLAELDDISEDSFSLVVHNIVRKAAPSEPRVNKVQKADANNPEHYARLKALEADGYGHGLVSAAACDTLHSVYAQALFVQSENRGLMVTPEQNARLNQIGDRGDAFFRRIESVRSARDLERWCAEHVTRQRFVREAELDERLRVRNVGSCTGQSDAACAFQPLCERGEPASTRPIGSQVIGYMRVNDLHEEVRNAEKERDERKRTREERRQRLSAQRCRDVAQEKEARQADGAAPGEGEHGRQGGRSSAEADHSYF